MQINEKFYMLPKEKQQIIINAGLECFGQYGYQKANTERIALKAGISKALLFHYFINKKNFYLFLCDFCKEVSADLLDVDEMLKITDFFELVDFSMQTKWKIMTKYPYLTNFALNAFYSQEEKTTSDVNKYIETELNNSFDTYFRNIDFSKFKENVEPKYIYHMLVMLSDRMMKFSKRDSRKMIKEMARLHGLSVSEVREQIQGKIIDAMNSDDPEQQAEFKRMFGNSTPTPEEFICVASRQLKF